MLLDIGSHSIGENHPTYIIAEIGINHNGCEETALKCIDAAAAAGVDAVKFQKRHLPSLYAEDVLDHPETFEQNFQYMIPLLKKIELSNDSYVRLQNYCRKKKIDFLCTPFDLVSAKFLNELSVEAYKIASADLTNSLLLEYVSSFKKPMIVSTGMSSWSEVERAVHLLQDLDSHFALLHCRSVYPVWPRDVNLKKINRLKQFGVPVGYSGHETGITISLVAASMGANIIEKHITLDRKQEGPDHKVSLEPYELKRLVRDIRIVDQAMGQEKRFMLRGEVLNRELFSKSLIANQNLIKGTVITKEMVVVKGPGKGLAPDRMRELLGVKLNRDINRNAVFVEEDLGDEETHNFNQFFKSDWGLIARFTDYKKMLAYNPEVIEFHLAEKDFEIPFNPDKDIGCKLVVHVPEYLGEKLMDLCSGSEEIRKASVDLVLKTIRLTNKIKKYFKDTPKIIAHPGAMSMKNKLDKIKLRTALVKSLKEIRSEEYSKTIELLFENLPPYPWYFGGQWKGNFFMDGNEIAEFCKEQGLKICFDLSHAALYCNAKEKDLARLIKSVLPYTSHLHLADGYGLDGEGVQFGEGDIDLDNILPLFSGFRGTWVPEVWRGHLNNGQGFLQALEYLQKYLN
jgi:sialic acid synthase SpsE/sugar phosphate isomerase/epimerase